MPRVAVSGATRAPRCRGWHEVRVDERTFLLATRPYRRHAGLGKGSADPKTRFFFFGPRFHTAEA
eukprot:2960975-Prymnesium_polylepis.1